MFEADASIEQDEESDWEDDATTGPDVAATPKVSKGNILPGKMCPTAPTEGGKVFCLAGVR